MTHANNKVSRRHFLERGATAVGGVAAVGGWPLRGFAAGKPSPNNQLRIGVIGLNGRGKAHLESFSKVDGAQVVALSDCDLDILGKAADSFEREHERKVETFQDYRRLLERDDIDAISIATPNHWHALMAIDAIQAGKHVYVEKPVCHTLWEGRQLVKAARKQDRLVAAGFQNRSDVGLDAAFAWLREGHLGEMKMARGLCYRNRASIGRRDTALTPPASVDYDLCLGPAADLPMFRPQFHYDWHWIWNTGNGDMGNQGPHEMDVLRWALGDPGHPQSVMSFGGRFGWNDASETPNTQFASFDFGTGVPVVFEVRDMRLTPTSKERASFKGRSGGVILTYEGGEFRGGRGGGSIYVDGVETKKFKGDKGVTHFANFCEAVRNNDLSSLRSPVESAYYSSSLSHLANLSLATGGAVSAASLSENLASDALATEAAGRMSEHLQAWDVDLEKTPWTLGSSLDFDPEAERFVGGDQRQVANKFLHREDRPKWTVPEIA